MGFEKRNRDSRQVTQDEVANPARRNRISQHGEEIAQQFYQQTASYVAKCIAGGLAMGRFLVVAFVSVFSGSLSSAQTSDDLAAKYKRITAYEVRPGILMTASFGAKGQICEMALQRNRYPSENRVDLMSPLPKFDELLDELAPPSERGAAVKQGFSGFVSGNVIQTKLNYENVSIDEVAGFSNPCTPGAAVIIIRWKNRGCTFPMRTENHNDSTPAPPAAK